MASDAVPTVFEVAGGTEALERWLNRFYDLVELDEGLGPVFGGTVSETHRRHVVAWWAEVMGGPPRYSDSLGGYEHMLSKHHGLAITPQLRRRFTALLSQAADEAGLASIPELRAALMGYAEWGSWLAVENSAPDAEPMPHAPVPRWGWGVAPPYNG